MLRLADSAAEKVRIGGTEVLNRTRAIGFARHLMQVVFWALVLLLTYEWIGFVLGRFPFTRVWGEQLNAFLVTTTVDLLTAIAQAVPELDDRRRDLRHRAQRQRHAAEGSSTASSRAASKVGWLDADSARPTRRLATIAVWIFALAMAYPYIPGSDTEAFKGLSVLLGLMVSIGGVEHRRPGGERADPDVHAHAAGSASTCASASTRARSSRWGCSRRASAPASARS